MPRTDRKRYGYIDPSSFFNMSNRGSAMWEWRKLVFLFDIPDKEQSHVALSRVDGEVYADIPVEKLYRSTPLATATSTWHISWDCVVVGDTSD